MLELQISLHQLQLIEQELPEIMAEWVNYLYEYGYYTNRNSENSNQYQLITRLDILSSRLDGDSDYLSETSEELFQMHICICAGYFNVEDIIAELDSFGLTKDLAAKLEAAYDHRGFDLTKLDFQDLDILSEYTDEVWNTLGIGNHFRLAGKSNTAMLDDSYGPNLADQFLLTPFKCLLEFVSLLGLIDEDVFAQWLAFEESTDSKIESQFQTLSIKAKSYGADFDNQNSGLSTNWLEIFSSPEEFGEYGSLVILTRTQSGLSRVTLEKLEWIADLLGKHLRTRLGINDDMSVQYAKDCASMMYAQVADYYDSQEIGALDNIRASHALFLDLDPIISKYCDSSVFTRLCNWVRINSPTQHAAINLLYNWGGDINHFWDQEDQIGIRFELLLKFRMYTECVVNGNDIHYTNDYYSVSSKLPWSMACSETLAVFKLALEYEATQPKSVYLSLLVGITVLRIKEEVPLELRSLAYIRFLEFLKSDAKIHQCLVQMCSNRSGSFEEKQYGMLVGMLACDNNTPIVIDEDVLDAIFKE